MNLRLIGYWQEKSDDGWPDPHALVDHGWDECERDRVAFYLQWQRGLGPWAASGPSKCRLCGQLNGAAEFTDGVYLWPEGLAHYVRDHAVRLPDE